MNFHLRAAGQPEITNLGSALKDSRSLTYVLNQLDPANCTLAALEEADDVARARQMIACATAMGVEDVLGPDDLVKGNAKVNSVFVAAIFNCKHGLQELTQEEFEAAGIIDDDIEGTREERALRLWINSMQIENCFVENLFEEIRDGLVILRVCHRIDNSTVDWSKPKMTPKNMFDNNHNCDLAIAAMQALGVRMVGVGSQDIRDGHKKNILAMVWQVMRAHYLKIIGNKTD
jgi:plastin-1